MRRKGNEMKTVSFGDYLKEMQKFAAKHNENGGVKSYTSPLENVRYHKEIRWEDGAAWYEVTERIWETVPIEVHGIKMVRYIEMWRTEFWNTDNGQSRFFYQEA